MKINLIKLIAGLTLYVGGYIVYAQTINEQILHTVQAEIMLSDASEIIDHQQALERSLQEFDEKLLRELEQTQQQRQENAKQKASLKSDAELEAEGEDGEGQNEGDSQGQAAGTDGSQNGNENTATADAEGSETGPPNNSNASVNDENNTKQKNESVVGEVDATRTQSTSSEHQQQGDSTTQVADIPTGDDDDVIARQLREAAQAETDPAIKEKLWEEYRKYKNQ